MSQETKTQIKKRMLTTPNATGELTISLPYKKPMTFRFQNSAEGYCRLIAKDTMLGANTIRISTDVDSKGIELWFSVYPEKGLDPIYVGKKFPFGVVAVHWMMVGNINGKEAA